MIEGRIQYRDYTDAQGIKKTICDIRCDNFVMLGRLEDGAPRMDTPKGGSDFDDAPSPMPPSANIDPTEDIPF
jgi:single-stranded DNA-binding protein